MIHDVMAPARCSAHAQTAKQQHQTRCTATRRTASERRNVSPQCCRLFGWSNETLHNGGNYILEVALHEYLLQVSLLHGEVASRRKAAAREEWLHLRVRV